MLFSFIKTNIYFTLYLISNKTKLNLNILLTLIFSDRLLGRYNAGHNSWGKDGVGGQQSSPVGEATHGRTARTAVGAHTDMKNGLFGISRYSQNMNCTIRSPNIKVMGGTLKHIFAVESILKLLIIWAKSKRA